MVRSSTAISLVFIAAMTWSSSVNAKQSSTDCGEQTACIVDNGDYHIALPDAWKSSNTIPRAAIMYFHGYNGSSKNVMRNKSMMGLANRLGVALIAPNGTGRGSWAYPGSPNQSRNEFEYVKSVRMDAIERFDLDADKLMATGFSMGGSMVWNLACHSADDFAGFAPVAGAFWNPLPQSCDGPIPFMIHIHGTADKTVPIAGRAIGTRWRQGDLWESLAILQKGEACEVQKPVPVKDGRFMCHRWNSCGSSGLVEVCLHDGGHSIRTEWIERAWNKLVAVKGWTL